MLSEVFFILSRQNREGHGYPLKDLKVAIFSPGFIFIHKLIKVILETPQTLVSEGLNQRLSKVCKPELGAWKCHRGIKLNKPPFVFVLVTQDLVLMTETTYESYFICKKGETIIVSAIEKRHLKNPFWKLFNPRKYFWIESLRRFYF